MLTDILLSAALAAAAPVATEVTAPGPNGALAGTLIDAGRGAPVVVIVPGSGPTDRDGNNPMGVTAASYRLLAEALAARGVSTLRFDKRGMFGSKAAIADPNAVTIAAYADDARAWTTVATARTGAKCAWLLGHSEGGLVALAAAQRPAGLCGVILVSAPGRPLATVMRAQLAANPANAPILPGANAALDALTRGERIDPATLPAPLQPIFNARVQPYLIDLFAQDPARLAAQVKLPVLVVQGDRDFQVTTGDAKALAAAAPGATLAIVPGVNHVLKAAPADLAGNAATYANPSLPVAPAVVAAIAGFVTRAK